MGVEMPYWTITPHENRDYDVAVLPAETEADHRAALDYAQRQMEDAWDSLSIDGGPRTVTLELHGGPIPDDLDGNSVPIPPGYRLLMEGEPLRRGDLYLKTGSVSWKPSVTPGGARWNSDGFWPMARKI